MSTSLVLVTFLWCVAGLVVRPGQGQISKRTDDVNPLVAVVDKLASDLLAVKAQLGAQENEIQAQESKRQAQQNEIDALKAFNAHTVAFSAYISDEPNVHAAKGSAAPFRGVLTNVGGGYSHVTSAFTAPVPGRYFFIIHSDCTADFRSLEVTLNGHSMFLAHNDLHDGHITGSGLLTMHEGDVVTTKYYNDAGVLDAGRESTFSGFLVK